MATNTNALYEALKAQFEAQKQKALATLTVYLTNPVGIGEHPQHLDEMDKLVSKMVDAQDKLDMITKEFNDYNSN